MMMTTKIRTGIGKPPIVQDSLLTKTLFSIPSRFEDWVIWLSLCITLITARLAIRKMHSQ
jgi:hypothetical protein